MRTTALKTSATYGGPAVFAAGAAMFAAALVGTGPARPVAQAPSAATVTVTAAQAPVTTRTTVTAHPRPSDVPASARAVEPRTAAAQRRDSGVSAAAQRPGAGVPSGPSPTPEPPAGCSGTVLAAQVLRAVCVSVGGSK